MIYYRYINNNSIYNIYLYIKYLVNNYKISIDLFINICYNYNVNKGGKSNGIYKGSKEINDH